MASSKKKCIVSVIGIAGSDQCIIGFNDNRYTDKIISSAGCFENHEKTSTFLRNVTSLIPPEEIKAFVMCFALLNSLKELQIVKQKIKEFCEKNQIFYAFPPNLGLQHIGMLCAAKPLINEGENIILVSTALFIANVQVYKLHQKEFVYVDGFKFPLSSDIPLLVLKQHITRTFKPKKIILLNGNVDEYVSIFQCSNLFERIVQALSKCDIIILKKVLTELLHFGAEILITHLMGEKESKYMVKFFADREIEIPSLIKCGGNENLPFEKSVVYKVKKNDYITLTEKDHGEIHCVDLAEYEFQQVRITLKIDTNIFFDLQVEPVNVGKKTVQSVKKVKESIPKAKLVFSQNAYMIFVWKNGKKKVIKDSTGSTKIPFCISFANEIPAVGTSAMKDLKEKPPFVVYNLLKLCHPNVLKNIDPKWSFKVIQDSDNTEQTVIQFETFRGPRETSVDFLLGMILKSSIVLIEKEIGIKVEEFGIEFESVFDGQEFIRRCLEKGAERIKIKVAFL